MARSDQSILSVMFVSVSIPRNSHCNKTRLAKTPSTRSHARFGAGISHTELRGGPAQAFRNYTWVIATIYCLFALVCSSCPVGLGSAWQCRTLRWPPATSSCLRCLLFSAHLYFELWHAWSVHEMIVVLLHRRAWSHCSTWDRPNIITCR